MVQTETSLETNPGKNRLGLLVIWLNNRVSILPRNKRNKYKVDSIQHKYKMLLIISSYTKKHKMKKIVLNSLHTHTKQNKDPTLKNFKLQQYNTRLTSFLCSFLWITGDFHSSTWIHSLIHLMFLNWRIRRFRKHSWNKYHDNYGFCRFSIWAILVVFHLYKLTLKHQLTT